MTGSLFVGGVNYLFNIVMARPTFLGPTEFGALAALTSLLYLVGIGSSALTTTVTGYVATYVAHKQSSHITYLLHWLLHYIGMTGLLLGLVLTAMSPLVVRVLHLSSRWPPLLIAVSIPLILLWAVTAGALQGILAFRLLALLSSAMGLLRLFLAIPLVGRLHLGVSGALLAGLIAFATAYVFSLWLLRPYVHSQTMINRARNQVFSARTFFKRFQYALLTVSGLSALFSVDLILARIYLSGPEAGLYSGLSTIGRIIYFITLPITLVVFPAITQRVSAGKPYSHIIGASGLGISLLALLFVGSCYSAPRLIIHLMLGTSYVAAAPDLWTFALFFSLISIATWLAYIDLALQRTKALLMPVGGIMLQIVFIALYHQSLHAIVVSSLVAATVVILLLGGGIFWSLGLSK